MSTATITYNRNIANFRLEHLKKDIDSLIDTSSQISLVQVPISELKVEDPFVLSLDGINLTLVNRADKQFCKILNIHDKYNPELFHTENEIWSKLVSELKGTKRTKLVYLAINHAENTIFNVSEERTHIHTPPEFYKFIDKLATDNDLELLACNSRSLVDPTRYMFTINLKRNFKLTNNDEFYYGVTVDYGMFQAPILSTYSYRIICSNGAISTIRSRRSKIKNDIYYLYNLKNIIETEKQYGVFEAELKQDIQNLQHVNCSVNELDSIYKVFTKYDSSKTLSSAFINKFPVVASDKFIEYKTKYTKRFNSMVDSGVNFYDVWNFTTAEVSHNPSVNMHDAYRFNSLADYFLNKEKDLAGIPQSFRLN
jgi:hypothetical protein